MNNPPPDVVVAGQACLDIIVALSDSKQLPDPGKSVKIGQSTMTTGGCIANTGLALHRLGVNTRLMGKIGDDLIGRKYLDIVNSHHPALSQHLTISPDEDTAYTIVVSPISVDRAFLYFSGANETFGLENIRFEQLPGAKIFHIGYPTTLRQLYIDEGQTLAAILQRVKAMGLTTSLDLSFPDPQSEASQISWPTLLERVLPYVDIFLPSIEEITFMLDRPYYQALVAQHGSNIVPAVDLALLQRLANQLLSFGTAMVGLTLGDQGLYLQTTADISRLAALHAAAPQPLEQWCNRTLLAPSFQANFVGNTGAGDCAFAAFLTGLLHHLSPEQTLIHAVGAGSANVEAVDATSSLPSWDQLQQRIAAGWPQNKVKLSLPGWRWQEASKIWVGPNDNQTIGESK